MKIKHPSFESKAKAIANLFLKHNPGFFQIDDLVALVTAELECDRVHPRNALRCAIRKGCFAALCDKEDEGEGSFDIKAQYPIDD